MLSNKKKIAIDDTGLVTLLHLNGSPIKCAYRNDVLRIIEGKEIDMGDGRKQVSFPKQEMHPTYCSNECQHFHYHENPPTVNTTCGCCIVTHPIDKNIVNMSDAPEVDA